MQETCASVSYYGSEAGGDQKHVGTPRSEVGGAIPYMIPQWLSLWTRQFIFHINMAFHAGHFVVYVEYTPHDVTAASHSLQLETSDNCGRRRTPPGPADLSSTPDNGPVQPIFRSYPFVEKLERKRSFRSDWYKQYTWLDYLQQANAVFCFVCRHFPLFEKEAELAFTSVGFHNLNKANYTDAGFPQHSKGPRHSNAEVM